MTQEPLIGLINLDKPAGLSSAAALNRMKSTIPKGAKIGHAGTLDPFATGVLLVLIGKATKSCEKMMGLAKQYEATVKLGASTDTDDLESPEIAIQNSPIPNAEQIQACLQAMTGVIHQKPPKFSALKIDGKRAYKLARNGVEVPLKPRPVRIDAIELLAWEWPYLRIRIDCGRGTYIRAIARDLGEMLGSSGYLTQLRRTRIGSFHVDNAVQLENVLSEGIERHLIPVES